MGTVNGTDSDETPPDDGTWLVKLYMQANQFIYAVVAFPIGTVLSVTPLYLFEQHEQITSGDHDRDLTIKNIGYFMAAGELIGIFGMLLSEHQTKGFVFRRPYDLYFINAALALSLIMITVWPSQLWYISAVFMMVVQFFNSASKPVLGESIHRLAVLMEKEPSIVFAKANMWRRVGNSMMGFITPMIYQLQPHSPFYVIGSVILIFMGSIMALDYRIKRICKDDTRQYTEAEKKLSKQISCQNFRLSNMDDKSDTKFENKSDSESGKRGSRRRKKRGRQSTISMISIYSSRRGKNSLSSLSSRRYEDENLDTSQTSEELTAHITKMVNFSSKDGDKGDKSIDEQIDSRLSTSTNGSDSSLPDRVSSASRALSSFNAIQESVEMECDDSEINSSMSSLNRVSSGDDARPSAFQPIMEMPESADDSSDGNSEINVDNNEDDDNPDSTADDKQHDLLEKGRIENFETTSSTTDPKEKKSKRTVSKKETSTTSCLDDFSYFLIVWLFPFWDAVISRLPFSFLMICLVYDLDKSIITAGIILFGYQIGRAIAQQIQVKRCDTTVNYILNIVALLAYLVFVIYTEVSDGILWFIPILFTGAAETLPIQQLYLVGLIGEVGENDMALRNAVKTSHTFTGIGSMVAFLIGSQIYVEFNIGGIAYLGLVVMLLKITNNLIIDYLHNKKERRIRKDYRQRRKSYNSLFSDVAVMPSAHFVG